jgi:hypothetical protein
MKRTFAIALFALATLAGVHSAAAQTNAVKATVPFAFNVGDKVLPSGTYSLSMPQAGTLLLRSGSQRLMVLVNNYHRNDVHGTRGRLFFTSQGGQYSLREVQSSISGIHAHVPLANVRQHSYPELATLESPTEIFVALD